MINKIIVTPLLEVPVVGGNVLHALKTTDIGYEKFGEAYFSWVNYNSIKAWKMHTKMIMNLIVPVGQVKFVFFVDDAKTDRNFRIIEIGECNYQRLTVPPGIWFGFKGLGKTNSLVCNISNILHSESEVIRKRVDTIDFNWSS
jgi:dTDP-4-dehydrorhamnose 3,5-epimerase